MNARSPIPWVLPLVVALLATAPRVGPATRAFHCSPDAAEYLLLARSLADGRGFVLPIRVRFGDTDEPIVHEAFAERAPLYPLLLSVPVSLTTRPGWPDPAIQFVGVCLAALAAVLATLLGWDLARRQGFSGRAASWAALLGGLAVAWYPDLVRASVHLWAEPLAIVILLSAVRHYLALDGHSDPPRAWPRAIALGLLCGLARYARPEAWVLVPVFLALLLCKDRRTEAAAFTAVVVAINLIGTAATGVLAPQLSLLTVADYADLMTPATASAPTFAEAAEGVANNLFGQLAHMATPRYAFLVLPLALLAARRASARPLLLLAAGLVLATSVVWSTHDPSRFTLAPLCLLAPVAAVEFMALRRRFAPGNAWIMALAVGLWAGVLGQRSVQEARRSSPPPPPQNLEATENPPTLEDPWTYALITGQPAVLSGPPPR